MIDKDTELDSALTRLVDAEDRIDELAEQIREKDDAIAALLEDRTNRAAELAAAYTRIRELELLLDSKAAG